jgi:DNA-binding LacI/PurR family transcriptional regulator
VDAQAGGAGANGYSLAMADGRSTEDETARRSPTMHDVAARAGVSHQTVSRVLNGFESIRPATRDRVLAAIAELGYRRNLAARTLATNRSRAIGILAPAGNEYGPTSTVQAIEIAARAAGYHPLVTTTASDRESILAGLGFLLDQAVEALVVIAPQQRVLAAIEELELAVPIMTLQSLGADSATTVSVDQAGGARMAVQHLLDRGHRRIQHVSGPDEFFEASARRSGYESAMAAAGLQTMPLLVGDWTPDAGLRAASLLDPKTTAVFSGNDQMALGLISGLAARGRHVPEDVSVVGFDDVPEARFYLPALTTVRQDFGTIGRIAVESLIRQVEGRGAVAVAPLEAELVVRDSTAGPSKR